ncbi:protein DPCD, partial [Clonorchis sinensis]
SISPKPYRRLQPESGRRRRLLEVTENGTSRYYKRFDVPDMQRMNLPLKQDALSLSHANNTLLISVSPLIRSDTKLPLFFSIPNQTKFFSTKNS